jgi:hypothetical protein
MGLTDGRTFIGEFLGLAVSGAKNQGAGGVGASYGYVRELMTGNPCLDPVTGNVRLPC